MAFMENKVISEEKADWRRRMAAVRDGLAPADRQRLSDQLCARLENGLLSPLRSELGRSLSLCVYAPYRSEASPLPLLQGCRDKGDLLVAPRMKPEGGLELREVQEASDWAPGRWGVPEPDPLLTRLVPTTIPLDIVLVPGMVYSLAKAGTIARLGYGGGYYDRLYAQRETAAAEGTLWVGFAYAIQVVAEPLPAESHDLLLHALATEQGIMRIGEGDWA
jgi:5-formyltetrahydrofolate cyclo-ligase